MLQSLRRLVALLAGPDAISLPGWLLVGPPSLVLQVLAQATGGGAPGPIAVAGTAAHALIGLVLLAAHAVLRDRKSTRLNSSH